jgi:hypothetical protein
LWPMESKKWEQCLGMVLGSWFLSLTQGKEKGYTSFSLCSMQ